MPAPELFDLVDRNGTIIGQALRRECHGDPSRIHRTVHVIVTNRAGDVFLQKRGINKDIQPGRWDTSVGGHVAPGETIEDAVRRELEEELGVSRDDGHPRFLYRYLWESPVETELVSTYHIEHEGPFRLQAEEIDEGRFWSCAEIEQRLGKGGFTPNFELEFEKYRQS